MFSRILAGATLLAALNLMPALADDGHNHGASPAPSAGPALPRFAAASELFELVGVVDKKRLVVYLDRFDDNSPVKAAHVELEIGGMKITPKEAAEGEFEAILSSELPNGVLPMTATVVAGNETDILAADLDIHGDAHLADSSGPSAMTHALWAVAAMVVLLAMAWVWRRAVARRQVGGVA